MAETSTRKHLFTPYVQGHGVDLGSSDDPITPWAVCFDTTYDYRENHRPIPNDPVHFRLDATRNLPFRDGVLDFVYSSHLLEDFADWDPILAEWWRVIKPGGYLLLLLPDKARFADAVRRGQPGNPHHQHETYVGELTTYAQRIWGTNAQVIADRFTDLWPEDYNVMFVCRKLA